VSEPTPAPIPVPTTRRPVVPVARPPGGGPPALGAAPGERRDRLAAAGGDNWDITTISTDGTVGPPLTDSPEEDNFPVVSPDRRTIAYLHRTSPTSREVRVMGADGSGDRSLFTTPPRGCTDVTRPAFNGPALRLVLPCLDAASGATTLTLVELDGTVVSVVDRGAVGDPAMAPDGLSAVYWKAAEAGQDGGEIYWASLDGSSPAGPVTAGDDRDNDPAISPTDNVAAFTRPGQGIWTVGLQAGNPLTQLTTRDGDMDPSFSPDGTQITFKRQDEVW
jgi:Tol biopolymer transport system component